MFILDSHCDTPSQILRLRDLSIDNDHAHVDFPKLLRGGVDGAFFALYVPARFDSDPDKGLEYAENLLSGVKDAVRRNSGQVAFAYAPSEAMENKAASLFSIFLGLENASPIGNDISRVKHLYDNGVRYFTLCHSSNNCICDSCASDIKMWGGLSPFGKEVIAEMNRLGILVDVSHVSDDTFYDVLKYSSKPVVATHSCCRALASHQRNLSDEMIVALASAGGVVQINFYPLFLDDGFRSVLQDSGIMERGESVEAEFIADPSDPDKRRRWNSIQDELMALPRPSYKRIVDHIDHVVSLVGVDHVGLGSDFDGIEVTPEGLEDISMMPKIFDEMRLRGYSNDDIEKIAGLNFFRVMSA